LLGATAMMYGLSDLLALDNIVVLLGVIATALAGIGWQAKSGALLKRR
jgi:hypothetical protein